MTMEERSLGICPWCGAVFDEGKVRKIFPDIPLCPSCKAELKSWETIVVMVL